MNGSPVSTTFNSGTQVTANVDQAQPGVLDLQVLNPNPGPAASNDLIATVSGTIPTPIVPPSDAARFLEQATFGPTDADIRTLSLEGYSTWLSQQFALPPTPTEPGVEMPSLHEAQLLSYLKLSGCPVGLLINFNVRQLITDIKRLRI